MTPQILEDKISEIAALVVGDPRWENESDDLGVSILGMLLYGFALAEGRMVMMLEIEDINQAVINALVNFVGSAPKWTGGLVHEASLSAFDKERHPAHFNLIGIGHSYMGVGDKSKIIENIYANILSFRNL